MRAVSHRPAFRALLESAWRRHNSMLCVGLDPDFERLPRAIERSNDGVFTFCQGIVDATADIVCAFKPQFAHFAAVRAEEALERLIGYIHDAHPGVPVILDAKRGDVGSTARMYARELFERYDADAATVNAYLGPESLAPYLEFSGRGIFVLCRTSNPDSAWLQNHPADDPTFLRVAHGASEWDTRSGQPGNIGLVVGATYPEDLARVRDAAPDLPLLVPGVGAQGGDHAAVLRAGRTAAGTGLLFSASRSVIYAGSGADFADQARAAAKALSDQMRVSDEHAG